MYHNIIDECLWMRLLFILFVYVASSSLNGLVINVNFIASWFFRCASNYPIRDSSCNMRRRRMITGWRSNHWSEWSELRRGDTRWGCSDTEDQQEDEPADTRRRQSTPFVYHQPAYSDSDRPISRARSLTSRKSRESSATESRVSYKFDTF